MTAQTHKCTIDTDQIQRTFDRYNNDEHVEEHVLTGEYIEAEKEAEKNNAWEDEALLVAMTVFERGVPGWEIPEEKQIMFAKALARVARKHFPGGLPNIENWGPWANLGYATVMCAMAGIDMETMKFKPRKKPDSDTTDDKNESGPCYTEGEK